MEREEQGQHFTGKGRPYPVTHSAIQLLMLISDYVILQISLSGHLFDKFLINEALDIIEAAGGSFHLVKCQVGQRTDAMSYSELEVSETTLKYNVDKMDFTLWAFDMKGFSKH